MVDIRISCQKKKLLVKDSIPGAFVSSAKLPLGALST